MTSRDTGLASEALRWLSAGEAFDMAILDMHMPEMDGLQLGREIAARYPALPLVLFSSLGQREAGESEGLFKAYLTKPIRQSHLFEVFVSLLGHEDPRAAAPPVGKPEIDPGRAKRYPLRVLIAEDNVVNQKLALRLLQQMGYSADLACNGIEAVRSVERQTYDVVLMDVQMPELDGLDATRRICQLVPESRRPRIIAMTANAMQGDREMCIAAGMDDYITKPIRVDQLVKALSKAAVRDAPPVIDLPTFSGLQEAAGAQFVSELVDTFLEEAPTMLAELRSAHEARAADTFRREAHSIKSNALAFGATRLGALARDLELSGLGPESGSLDALEAEYHRVAAALRALCNG